jgi:hypothetical protein
MLDFKSDNMKKLIICLAILSLVSCKKGILDIEPLDRVSEETLWSDANLVRAYETELYNAIPHGFGIHAMLSKHTDEAVNTTPSGQSPGEHGMATTLQVRPMAITAGSITGTEVISMYVK